MSAVKMSSERVLWCKCDCWVSNPGVLCPDDAWPATRLCAVDVIHGIVCAGLVKAWVVITMRPALLSWLAAVAAARSSASELTSSDERRVDNKHCIPQPALHHSPLCVHEPQLAVRA